MFTVEQEKIGVAHPTFDTIEAAHDFAGVKFGSQYIVHYVNPKYLSKDKEIGYCVEFADVLYFDAPNAWINKNLGKQIGMILWY